MALNQEERLRQLLGEDIPEGGTAEDTMFTTEEIEEFLELTPSLEKAAYEGWRVKAARLSSLVDTTEGNAAKKFSQLMDNANEMIKMYSRATTGPTEGRSRVGRARRAPLQW